MRTVGLKFDRSEPGFWVSGALHAALVAGLVFGFASQSFPDADEGIPVEVVTDAQLSEITRGEKTAKEPLPEPKLRADRVAELREERDPGEAKREVPTPPTRPAEMKLAEQPVEAAAPPVAPLPPARPEPVKPEPPRPEPVKTPEPPAPPKREELAKAAEQQEAELRAKAEAEAKAEAAAAKAKAAAEAKVRAEAEAKAKAEAEHRKRLAEAKAKADAEAKARKEAELAQKFDPNGIARLLQSRETAQSSGSTGREIQRTAALGTATGNSPRLSPSLRDALMGLLRDQLHRCWQPPIGAQSTDKPPVPSVRVSLKEDGSLAREPAVLNGSADPLFRTVADSATRAAKRCSPLRIPAQFQPYYQDWKDLVVNFDPRDLS
ncbi:MAG: tolA [Microvirga sp.]|nr:tolA [Microvirga sp.]